jgi:asparagine synthase (glutamine-hydrolysing)
MTPQRLAGTFGHVGQLEPSRLGEALVPDAATVVVDGPLRVAFTAGAPADSRGPLCLLDGYLDNERDLRNELQLASACSTQEVLAAGWQRWGRELPRRMRGDFVLLIWDSEHNDGLLARDQLGIRSLFLSESAGYLCFATEIRFLLSLLPRRPPPDAVGVAHWIGMSGRPGSGTLYAGVRSLGPGSMVLLGDDAVAETAYWAPRFVEPLFVSEMDFAARVRESMVRAVGRRVNPAGLTGVMMSGGLDSASVAAIAAERAPGHVRAYSAAFPDHPGVDESALIAELRSELGLPGMTAEVRPGGLVASALTSVRDWQVPLTSWGDFWASALLRAASRAGVKVMLGGDGGDELFGARFWLLSDRLRSGHPLHALAAARELPGAGDRPPLRALVRMLRDFGLVGVPPRALHELFRRPFARRDIPSWIRPRAARDLLDSADPYAWKQLDGPRWWAGTAHLLTSGVEEAGVFEDHRHRATSAGVDARHPLFDLDLLELGLRQPPMMTFDRYRDRPIMRLSMEGLLPDVVRLRAHKALFNSILVDSLLGPDRAAVDQLLGHPNAELGAYVDLKGMRASLLSRDAPMTGAFQWMEQVWRLVTMECWLRSQAGTASATLDSEIAATAPSLMLRQA